VEVGLGGKKTGKNMSYTYEISSAAAKSKFTTQNTEQKSK
jgi:hypothetical protein